MDKKKHILLLTTGGTIASLPGGEGLEPHRSDVMERQLSQLRSYFDITVEDLMCLDSSNIRPAEWQQIAKRVFELRLDYDGIVISHGTDTMAYTASAITWMLPGIDRPVVLTGSQLPLADPLSDGPDNLRTAFAMAASEHPGIYLAFDRKVMLGCRAVKVRASGFSAFESVNAKYAAKVSNLGLVIDKDGLQPQMGFAQLMTDVSSNVFLLKLTPGLDPSIFGVLADIGYKGIVIEAFGLGGVNVLNEGLDGIKNALSRGVSVVVTTQCLYDSSDLKVYQVGKKLLDLGVIQGRDMTSEAAMTKLMWAIGQGMTQKQIESLFTRSLAGEIEFI
ncbi:MAG: asparaginase [Clostridia bacterium]|nr:asparaginase [Clostridia bacterium]